MIDFQNPSVRAAVAEIYPQGVTIDPSKYQDERFANPDYGELYIDHITGKIRKRILEDVTGSRIIVSKLGKPKNNPLAGIPKWMRLNIIIELSREQTFAQVIRILEEIQRQLINNTNKTIVPILTNKGDINGSRFEYSIKKDQRK